MFSNRERRKVENADGWASRPYLGTEWWAGAYFADAIKAKESTDDRHPNRAHRARPQGRRRGWFSLRSVGSAQSPELRPSGVETTRRLLGATRAPRNCETNRIGFAMKTGVNHLWWNWMRSAGMESSIRFVWNENTQLRGSGWTGQRTAEGARLQCRLKPAATDEWVCFGRLRDWRPSVK